MTAVRYGSTAVVAAVAIFIAAKLFSGGGPTAGPIVSASATNSPSPVIAATTLAALSAPALPVAPASAKPTLSPPMTAASAIAEGESILKREKVSEADYKPMLAGKTTHLSDDYMTKAEDADAKAHLGEIDKNAKEYLRAQALLKAMAEHDKKADAFVAAWEEKGRTEDRKDFATHLENSLVDGGLNVDVSAFGTRNTTLQIKYVLASKVFAHQLSQSGILDKVREAGFKVLRLTDGYDESFTWKLDR